jgi:exo-1,4-beta-D-glucosaminidase
VRLVLEDASGKAVSTNFYWLSTKPDDLDWDQSTWYYTPQKSYADYTALNNLPPVELRYSAESTLQGAEGGDGVTRVTVENPSRHLAFAVHLMVKTVKHDEEDVREEAEILPVIWEDNYFPLMPGEKRTVAATYKAADAGKKPPAVQVEGWNVR